MEIGKRIRHLRTEAGISQEGLAENVFVSRQTISNWENDKFYPDVQSLALIANLFGTSIDHLVKGDLPMINEKILEEDVRVFERNALLYGALLVVSLVVAVVAIAQENWLALGSSIFMFALSVYFSFLVDHDKKRYDIRTYREIRAFCNGASLDEIKAQRTREQSGARSIRRILLYGCMGVVIGLATVWIVRMI